MQLHLIVWWLQKHLSTLLRLITTIITTLQAGYYDEKARRRRPGGVWGGWTEGTLTQDPRTTLSTLSKLKWIWCIWMLVHFKRCFKNNSTCGSRFLLTYWGGSGWTTFSFLFSQSWRRLRPRQSCSWHPCIILDQFLRFFYFFGLLYRFVSKSLSQ